MPQHRPKQAMPQPNKVTFRSTIRSSAALVAALALLQSAHAQQPRLKLDYLESPIIAEAPKEEAQTLGGDPAAIETASGGRLGIALVDAKGSVLLGFNRDERFAMCSTFKAPLAAAVLSGAEKGHFGMDGTLPLKTSDVLDYAPVVKANLSRGRMTISDLAKAAVEVSDNSAANILLPLVGGPGGLTGFMRTHGDFTSRLDRTEPTLNENAQGDERDTTSPVSMATLMAKLLFHDMPAPAAQSLRGWLEASSTGSKRIRAGLPRGWSAGDKTGTCKNAMADVAVLHSPRGNDYVLAIYLDRPAVSNDEAEATIANATRAAMDILTKIDQNR